MTDVFKALSEFEKTFNPSGQGFNLENLSLRKTLITEEFMEVYDELNDHMNDLGPLETKKPKTLDHLTKELADLLYVVVGTAVVLDLPLEEVFKRVHMSNMSKVGDDGKPIYRKDGKILKGPNYKPPILKDLF